jgi:hypothetical protein
VYLRDSAYIFQLSNDLFLTEGILQTCQAVFADLRCQTGINFWMDSVNAAPVSTPANDGINLISIQPNNAIVFSATPSGTLAVTDINSNHCSTGLTQYNNNVSYATDIDISFVANPTYQGTALGWNWWLYVTNYSSIPWQIDAPSVLTHELGHAAQLVHTLPYKTGGNNVMYPVIPPAFVQRYYDHDSNSILGINHVLSLGDTLAAASGCPSAAVIFPTDCPILQPVTCSDYIPSGIQEIAASTGFSAYLYPNPYQDNTTVHVVVSQYENFSITAYDVIGHLLMKQAIATGTSFDIPLSNFNQSAGMYLIRVSDSYSSIILKLVKL